jgi:RNA polymerase sigma factor for flagellar operon FliA
MAGEAVWQAFAKSDPGAREALVKEHLNLVRHVAKRMSASLSAQADFDELVSLGSIGLLGALEAFDPRRGLAFSTFAVPRIRGAILDELRRQDHVPRSIRWKSREMARACETLSRSLGRAPTPRQIADHLGLTVEQVWQWQADEHAYQRVSLDAAASATQGEDGLTLEAVVSDGRDSAEDSVFGEEDRAALSVAIASLKEHERLVLTLSYFEELKLREIAEVLGVTESRVSQVRSRALLRLRAAMMAAGHAA